MAYSHVNFQYIFLFWFNVVFICLRMFTFLKFLLKNHFLLVFIFTWSEVEVVVCSNNLLRLKFSPLKSTQVVTRVAAPAVQAGQRWLQGNCAPGIFYEFSTVLIPSLWTDTCSKAQALVWSLVTSDFCSQVSSLLFQADMIPLHESLEAISIHETKI